MSHVRLVSNLRTLIDLGEESFSREDSTVEERGENQSNHFNRNLVMQGARFPCVFTILMNVIR